MKIAINTRFLLKDKLEGIGWFTHETVKRLVHRHPEIEFHFLFDRKFDDSFIYGSNVVPHVLAPQARHPLLWQAWFEYAVPRKLKKIKPELFLSADGYTSLKSNVASHLVIHDLAFEHYPEDLSSSVANYYRKYTPQFVKKASRIATVSKFSAEDIEAKYGLQEDQVDVVYNGVNSYFRSLEAQGVQETRDKYTNGEGYFLFVGAMHPRKNITRLFQAFELFKNRTGSSMKLVVVGRKGWGTSEMEKVFNESLHKDDIRFTGRLETKELSKVLGAAHALTYVPYFEGFGIPIIEAQQCGVPVITSNVSSMPEVVGEAGVTVDPFSVDDIASKLALLVQDVELYQNLKLACQDNLKRFSWDKTTDLYWESIMKI